MKHLIANSFSGHLMTAISSTLMHSLWQGALLFALTGLLMTLTRKASSARRYNLLVGAMALFAVTVAGTFIMELSVTGASFQLFEAHSQVVASFVPDGTTLYSAAAPASLTGTISIYLNGHAGTIVWIWFLIMCARCIQLTIGLGSVHNLRHKNISAIGSYWEERVQQLCAQLGIKRLVGIAESGRTKIPMIVGHLKPLILVPIGMLTSLSIEEAETILLHELAHIRRADYLVNLLQNLMEIVFFFNPAVLWLSAMIKTERENCCDDMVLVRSRKVDYLKALVACEEYNQQVPAYAMALKGNQGSLKNRVTRIVSNKNLPLNSREKSLLAACLIVAGIFATTFVNGEKLNKLVTLAPKIAASGKSETTRHPDSDDNRTKSLISDLVKDGIITSTNDLSFKIGNNEFIVNYKRQPEVIHQKYRVKYVADQRDGNWAWFYHFDNSRKLQ